MSSGSLFQLFYGDDVAGATALLSRDGLQTGPTAIGASKDTPAGKLSKQDINKRDPLGRTVLHLASSKGSLDFVKALLENPATDVNLLDIESGWSALHRALYNGRIACAQYIIANRGRDTIKAKDRESNSPFDVLNSTLNGTNPPPLYDAKGGSDLFTFGSNKNNSLGFGDGDDRAHPERVHINRPPRKDESSLSMFTQSRIRDVQMAKMHTAILTTDPRDNLYTCGFNGTTGRLGLSTNQSTGTQFVPKPVLGINDSVAAVALGQDHTIAVTKSGAVWTWGSNQNGQLGYPLDLSLQKDNVQKVPRKIISSLKKIEILGVAASNLHSVCFSDEDLYTWGLNRGQLGYSSGDEGPIQSIPKKVATLPAPVEMVTAIDNATICLLKNKVVLIFANGGYFRVTFPLDRFADNFGVSLSSVFRPRQMYAPNIITKVSSGGNTICAVSSMGDVFSFSLSETTANYRPADLGKTIKPQRIWSLRRRHMAVRDVAVGQDGTVIISTESGSVWTRIRRAKPKIAQGKGAKEYKFARVANLTRIVAVRANNAGAYAAIRNDVELDDILIEESLLEDDLIMSIGLGEVVEELLGEEGAGMQSAETEDDEVEVEKQFCNLDKPWQEFFLDVPVLSNSCDVAFLVRGGHRLYFHKAILVCRSSAFREFLRKPGSRDFKVEMTENILEVNLEDVGIVAAAQLLHHLYTDRLFKLPEFKDNHQTERMEMIKELRTLATRFGLKHLADVLTSPWYVALQPERTLRRDLQGLLTQVLDVAPPDAILVLSDREVPCCSFILAARCPFFEAMLDSAGLGGGWVASRRKEAQAEGSSAFRIQLPHLSYSIMSLVLEHIYTDAGAEIFNQVRKGTSEEFLEFVIEVMAVANEFLLDRLKDICQFILARFVTLRNVATILEEADTYAAEQLKEACLDYCAINAEALLENKLLDDLDPEIMSDLEVRVRLKQVERLPISRGEILLHDLASRYPNLEDDILQEHEARQFTSVLGTSLSSSLGGTSLPSTPVEWRNPSSKPSSGKKGKRVITPVASSPLIRPTPSDMIFDMDDDLDISQASPAMKQIKSTEVTGEAKNPWRDASGKPLKEQPPVFISNQRFRLVPESVSADLNGQSHEGWSEVKPPVKGKRENGLHSAENTPRRSISQHATPSRSPLQGRPSSNGLPSPNLSTPGASPWKKPEPSPSIPFTSLVQEQQSAQSRSSTSTFPPSTSSSLPTKPPTQTIRPKLPATISTDSTSTPRRPSTSTTPTQIRSVPGKFFQKPSPKVSPVVPDMFPALGNGHLNLADIIAQQTSEQAALSAKALPRSLKEIQEEEQFLLWWEKESLRVKEEEELIAKTAQMSLGMGRNGGGEGGEGEGEEMGGEEVVEVSSEEVSMIEANRMG